MNIDCFERRFRMGYVDEKDRYNIKLDEFEERK